MCMHLQLTRWLSMINKSIFASICYFITANSTTNQDLCNGIVIFYRRFGYSKLLQFSHAENSTVATRCNVLEGTWKFWPLNPSVIKLNFYVLVIFFFFFAFRCLFDEEMQLTKELKAKNGHWENWYTFLVYLNKG